MRNELLLVAGAVLSFGGLSAFYRLFGKAGLYVWIVIGTILANIEVLILIHAFGMDQTLGNILFATTLTATDLLSEDFGEADAKKGVHVGLAASVFFLLTSQLWRLYTPATADFSMPAIEQLFSMTPRLVIASLVVYAVVERLDVWLYHRIWEKTTARCGDAGRFLWLRSNAATLVSQVFNAVLFNLGAFLGIYSGKTLATVILSTFIIYAAASLMSTSVVYLIRRR